MAQERNSDVAAIARLVDGATVSVDVSTGDRDAFARVFGTVYSVQRESNGTLTLLAEGGERNEPNLLRELAEWLVKAHAESGWTGREPTLDEVATRARHALGKED